MPRTIAFILSRLAPPLCALALLAACGSTPTPLLTVTPPPTSPPARPSPVSRTAVTPASSGTVAVGQAYRKLQALDNYRLTLALSGFAVAGQTGDLTVNQDVNKSDQHVTVQAGQARLSEAYQSGDKLFVRQGDGAFQETDAASPSAATAQALLNLPKTLLTNLLPARADFTLAGTDANHGQPATKYAATVPLDNLAFVNPALRGQSGSAAMTVWVDDATGALAATEATITSNNQPAAHLRLDVTDVGKVGPLAPPK
ncbi:MAG: LppX_LprAFG lipoprotein [Thermomicrobiales bacterium]